MDDRLADVPFLAGESYSIADIAAFPWTRSHERQGQDLDDFPNVKRWHNRIAARPAVERGLEVLQSERREGFDDEAKRILFGAGQYQRR
jgi:GST-like protein